MLTARPEVLIAYRIWHVRRGVEHLTEGRDAVSNLVGIILESAGFYTILLVVHIILLGIRSLVEYICIDMEAPVIGIVVCSQVASDACFDNLLI